MGFMHSGTGELFLRTVESSGSKLSAKLGNFSPAAIWQAKSYIELFTGFADIGGAAPIDDAATQCFDSYKAPNVKRVVSWGNIT